tara:strand:- start:102 stop:584 length:483 start_codon:yes stop_codon:yes gene_type:complete
MGRAANSFTAWVGHAEETIDEDRVDLPETSLWVAVLCRAALDAFKGPPRLNMDLRSNVTHKNNYTYDRDQARHFFMQGGSHFREICEMAGRNPMYVREKARKIILRKEGWNVDVPITSHYRRSEGLKGRRKRGRPRKLTGNSYYAMKGKNERFNSTSKAN